MKRWIIVMVVLAAGILLGIAVRPLTVRAQTKTTAKVYVDEVSTPGNAVRGSQIVGFSCAVDGTGAIHCYAASIDHR